MFTNTKLLSPVVTDGLCRAHPKSAEYRLWWMEQRRRCIEGYKVGDMAITGPHYFYLNFWKIKGLDLNTGRKGFIYPRFLDLDYEYFWELDKAKRAGENMCVGKKRQCGFSEKHASLCGHEFTFYGHSQSVIVAAEDKYNQNTMKMTLRGLNHLADTEFYKRKTPNTPDYIQAKYKVIDRRTGAEKWKGSFSEIYSITAKDNTEALSGLSPHLIIMEETGLWPKATDTFRYIAPMIKSEGVKTGMCIIVGTGGSISGGMEELMEFFLNPEAYGIRSYPYYIDLSTHDSPDEIEGYTSSDDARRTGFFVPAWKYKIIDENGNSLKKESLEKIKEEREKARKSKKAASYYTTVTQDPLTIEEMFMVSSSNRFNRDALYMQASRIMKDKKLSEMPQKGFLRWVRNEQGIIIDVEWEKSDDGDIIIFEHPQWIIDKEENAGAILKYNNLYFSGTDSYDKPEAAYSKSELSQSIFKGIANINKTSNMYVARYTARPRLPEQAYENTAKLCYYYNCRNLIEYSNILIFKWYKDNGFEYMLKERPKLVYENVKFSKVNNREGVDPNTRTHWLNIYKDYIEEYAERMFDLEQIQKALHWKDDDPKYNCDITISSSLAVTHWKDEIKISVAPVQEEKFTFARFKNENGVMKMVFE